MSLMDAEAATDPVTLFRAWLREAEAQEPNDPNAVALATATSVGVPSVRMVLLKNLDERGFAFYTNAESRKGMELAENPRAAMCFHWKSLRRQVRVEGLVSELPDAEADAYFHTRSRGSQLGAVASRAEQASGEPGVAGGAGGGGRGAIRRPFRDQTSGAAMCFGRSGWSSG